jgi:hypothetical protein
MTPQPLAKIETKKITVSINRIKEHDSNTYYIGGEAIEYPTYFIPFIPFVPYEFPIKNLVPSQHCWDYIIVDTKLKVLTGVLGGTEELNDAFKKQGVNFREDVIVTKFQGLLKDGKHFVIYKKIETWEIRVNEEN